jgi:hypothetical protein
MPKENNTRCEHSVRLPQDTQPLIQFPSPYPSGRMAICLHGPPGTACVDSVEEPDKGIHRILNSL